MNEINLEEENCTYVRYGSWSEDAYGIYVPSIQKILFIGPMFENRNKCFSSTSQLRDILGAGFYVISLEEARSRFNSKYLPAEQNNESWTIDA